LVHDLRAEALGHRREGFAHRLADAQHVARQALQQDGDLRQQQRVQQQHAEQRRKRQRQHQQQGRDAARHADPSEARGRRVEEVGDHGGQHEGRQDRREQPQRPEQDAQDAGGQQ
jgi:hypothetical protein